MWFLRNFVVVWLFQAIYQSLEKTQFTKFLKQEYWEKQGMEKARNHSLEKVNDGVIIVGFDAINEILYYGSNCFENAMMWPSFARYDIFSFVRIWNEKEGFCRNGLGSTQ